MKKDQQHLEFLVSQYVDNTLDAPNHKLVELQLASSPDARRLVREHQEVQEVLDEWGSRIPMINWDEFDQKLAERLERELPAVQRTVAWRRSMRPFAAAAALFLAAAVGYSWHAWTQPVPMSGPIASVRQPITPLRTVHIADLPAANGSSRRVSYPDAPLPQTPPAIAVTVDGTGAPRIGPAGVVPSSVTAGANTQPDQPDTFH